MWKPKKLPKDELETKTTSKFFVDANLEKITPKVSKKLNIVQILVVLTINYILGTSYL